MNIQVPTPPLALPYRNNPTLPIKRKNPWTCSGLEIKSVPFVSPSFLLPLICTSADVRACWPAHIPTPVVLASARVRVRSICASRARQARSELDALYHQAWLQKNAGLQKQTNKFAEWHYYYNDCYMILPYEKHDNFADQSMKTYKKWEKTTMLHTLHTTHYTIHTHTQYTLLYEYIQLWLWRNDQLLKTIRKIIKTCLFAVPRRYQIPLK